MQRKNNTELGEASMEDLRYPIGRFTPERNVTAGKREQWIASIEALPANLRAAVDGLSGAQLDTPYRNGGWSVRQVVHHLADSHLNGYIRIKLALTEDAPVIKTYDQEAWANQTEARTAPIAMSLALLDGLHQRWTAALRALAPAEFARRFTHPESGTLSVDFLLDLYAWHSRHHVAHIAALRKRLGW